MLEKLKLIVARYDEIESRMALPEVYNDPQAVAKLMREQKELAPVAAACRRYIKAENDIIKQMAMERNTGK